MCSVFNSRLTGGGGGGYQVIIIETKTTDICIIMSFTPKRAPIKKVKNNNEFLSDNTLMVFGITLL